MLLHQQENISFHLNQYPAFQPKPDKSAALPDNRYDKSKMSVLVAAFHKQLLDYVNLSYINMSQ